LRQPRTRSLRVRRRRRGCVGATLGAAAQRRVSPLGVTPCVVGVLRRRRRAQCRPYVIYNYIYKGKLWQRDWVIFLARRDFSAPSRNCGVFCFCLFPSVVATRLGYIPSAARLLRRRRQAATAAARWPQLRPRRNCDGTAVQDNDRCM